MAGLSKMLVMAGVLLIIFGVATGLIGKIPGIGKLPGDILIRKENFTFYFPLTTSLFISLVLTFLFSIFGKK